MMFVSLLLPLVLPYGEPCTFFSLYANKQREREFFTWINKVQGSYQEKASVPLLFSDDL